MRRPDRTMSEARRRAPNRTLEPFAALLLLLSACTVHAGATASDLSTGSGASDVGPTGVGATPSPSQVTMSTRTEPSIPSDFSLEMSSGGGFAGVYQGNRVTADGKVVHWRTAPNAGPRTEEALGTLEPAAVLRLVSTVETSGFFKAVLNQPGNMTVQITSTLRGKQHTVRYPLPMEQHPEAVRPVIEAIRTELKPLEKAREPRE